MKYAKRSITPSILLICFGLLLPLAAPGNAQQTTQAAQQPEARPNVQMLPPELRERGQALLNQKDELKRARLAGEMIAADPKATLEVNANTLTVKFIGTDLKTLYEYTLSRSGAP